MRRCEKLGSPDLDVSLAREMSAGALNDQAREYRLKSFGGKGNHSLRIFAMEPPALVSLPTMAHTTYSGNGSSRRYTDGGPCNTIQLFLSYDLAYAKTRRLLHLRQSSQSEVVATGRQPTYIYIYLLVPLLDLSVLLLSSYSIDVQAQ